MEREPAAALAAPVSLEAAPAVVQPPRTGRPLTCPIQMGKIYPRLVLQERLDQITPARRSPPPK